MKMDLRERNLSGFFKVSKLNSSGRYLCVDFETTSLNPEGEGIVEIYWMLTHNYNKIDEGHMVFYHENYKNTQHIHNISDEEINNSYGSIYSSDKRVVEFIEKFKNLIESCYNSNTLMAHYLPFESRWIEEKFGISIEGKANIYDTRVVERFLNPDVESCSLIPTCKRRNIESPNGKDFHRAQWDVEAMWKVALQQFKELNNKGILPGCKVRLP